MRERWNTADLEAGHLLHEVRAGAFDLLAEQSPHLLLVHLVAPRRDHQHGAA